jgi:hypothetical protein
MRSIGKVLGAAIAAGGLIVGGLFAGQAVFASSGISGDQATAAARDANGPLARVAHAEGTWTQLDGTTRDLSADIGEITSVKGGTVSLKRGDGISVSVPTTDSTCVRNNGGPATVADLVTGERAGIVQENGSAVAIRAGDPKAIGANGTSSPSELAPAADSSGAKGAESAGCHVMLGFVHGDVSVTLVDGSTKQVQIDRGMITALPGSSVTLLRRDGKTVSASFDYSTRVALDCNPASASDLRVGQVAMVVSQSGNAERISAMDGLERLRDLGSV